MQIARWITAVETHTDGEPTRIVTAGLAPLPGRSLTEKLHHFRAKHDDLRTALLSEPRGHRDMYGAILTAPVAPDADYGLFFMDNAGYMNMCGHGTIGVSTALVELGMVPVHEPTTRIVFDTPAGPVVSEVAVRDNRAESVSFKNVPAFADRVDAPLNVPGVGDLRVDLAYGGNWFAFFEAEPIGLEVSLRNIREVVDVGMRVMEACNARYRVAHPTVSDADRINIATVLARPQDPQRTYRNVHVFGARQFDRSPGGTGTCARMAVLAEKGKLTEGGEVRVESVTGGLFRGRILGRTTVGDRNAVIPEITGSAHLTGFHQFALDPHDRLRSGFPTEWA